MDAPVRSSRPTPGQLALAEQLARGEAALGTGIEKLSATLYLDKERFAREQERLFGSMPLLLGPSAMLPEFGQAIAHDDYGVPLIVSRDGDGHVHVLANVCRHRGTRLIESEGVVSAKRIVCPYHAWAYKADGSLSGLPRAECFPGLDKADYALRTFRCAESGGLIWSRRIGTRTSPRWKLSPATWKRSAWPGFTSTAATPMTWPQTGS